MALDDFERYPLLFGPSPVHLLDRLSEHLGGARIWAKREDCNNGLAFGGNKTRKLEYLVADALQRGADTLVARTRSPCWEVGRVSSTASPSSPHWTPSGSSRASKA